MEAEIFVFAAEAVTAQKIFVSKDDFSSHRRNWIVSTAVGLVNQRKASELFVKIGNE
jgi:CRISPR/Cas system CMR-associated protein Cmr1 (group 7 of RAMP superfamily)